MSDLTTIANLKQWLEINNTTNDVLLQRLVSSCSAFIQSWLNRSILQATYNEIYDGNGSDTLTLNNYPITSLLSVSVNGVAQNLLSPGDFTSAAYDFTSEQLYGQFMIFNKGRQNIAVSYVAGFATVPLDIEQACIELCALKYKNLRNERIGVVSKGLASESTAFFVGDMPPATRTLLNQFKNVVPL